MSFLLSLAAYFHKYAWFYDEAGYAVASILISIGSFIIALFFDSTMSWLIPLFTSISLFTLAISIFIRLKKIKK
ncbi:DUF7010 family protein [Albibacterium profundi]|uniref:DUF7010 family protein n=1 Tax=Albibacterium profundi TaxID=3134906 RepID=UPI0035CEFC60